MHSFVRSSGCLGSLALIVKGGYEYFCGAKHAVLASRSRGEHIHTHTCTGRWCKSFPSFLTLRRSFRFRLLQCLGVEGALSFNNLFSPFSFLPHHFFQHKLGMWSAAFAYATTTKPKSPFRALGDRVQGEIRGEMMQRSAPHNEPSFSLGSTSGFCS